jgi:serine/threonine protein kinase
MVLEYCNNKDMTSFFENERSLGHLKTEEEILMYFKQLLNAF